MQAGLCRHETAGQRAQRTDRAWLGATCLEELGASDVAQDLVIEQYRPDGPIRPRTAMRCASSRSSAP